MAPIIIHNDFKVLRQAYIEVKTFIESEVGDEVISLNTKLVDDLGCAGDDNWELLEKFVTKYQLDVTGFDYSKHFMSEGELFDSTAALLRLLSLPFIIVFWIIKIVTLGKVDLKKMETFPDWKRQTLDMTFGDMLTWYLAGKYSLRSEVKFRLENTV